MYRYSDSSATYTDQAAASVSFLYYGTSVSIYGSKRQTHGTFEVVFQGNTQPLGDGKPSGPGEQFNATLFDGALLQGEHTVILRNTEDKRLDVDTVRHVSSLVDSPSTHDILTLWISDCLGYTNRLG